ncbi:MAG: AAA family ATPase [Deltaproteobacteria bacterium]|nr:AAA family ATPase [Deltaproteobacteria bacterium]
MLTRPRVRLLSLDDLAALPPTRPLAGRLLQWGGLYIVIAPPGTGKSTLAVGLSLSISTGMPWLGEAVATGPVVYVSGEGLAGLPKRVDAWLALHPTVDRRTVPIRFVTEAINLLNESHVNALLATLTAMPPVLVVLDTLARCFGGGDENSASDMGKAVAACDRIRAATEGAVLLLHHPSKGKTDARGSGALLGAVDTAMQLASEDDGVLRLTCIKAKDTELFAPRTLRLLPVVLPGGESACVLQLVDVSAGTTRSSRLTPKHQHALETLARLGTEGATYTAWRQASGLTDTSMRRARTTLLGLGLVGKDGDQYRVVENRSATAMNSQTTANGSDLAAHNYSQPQPHPFRGGGDGGGGGGSADRDEPPPTDADYPLDLASRDGWPG